MLADERKSVFRKTWQVACRCEEVAAPGAYAAGEVAGDPFVVVRGPDGVLRAFHNVCRHKATTVAEGCGVTEALVCPYHGWSYHLDGRLKSAPLLGPQKAFSREDLGLVPLAVATFGPFVLVHRDRDASPPAWDDLKAELDASGWADLRWVARKTYVLRCNWKAFCDNYLDGGNHIAYIHPSLEAQLDMASYATECAPWGSVQRASGSDAERIGAHAIYAHVFPNLMLNRYGPVLDTHIVVPLSPERCRVDFDFWFAPWADAGFVARSMEMTDRIQREDIAVSERVQKGLGSGAYESGPYSKLETAVHHFHRQLSAMLTA